MSLRSLLRQPAVTTTLACAFAIVFGLAIFHPALSNQTSPSSATPEASPSAAATPSDDMPHLQLTINQLNDSGISGTVTLYDAGDSKTIVVFDVKNAGKVHPAHIHAGTCDDLGADPSYELEDVKDGKSTSTIEVALDDLLAEPMAVDLHMAPDLLGVVIGCANIEGTPETGPIASPAASATPELNGQGGETATSTPAPSDGTSGTGDNTPSNTSVGGNTTSSSTTQSNEETDIPLDSTFSSGVTGTVTLTPVEGGTNVSLKLSGDYSEGDIVHLHTGTCTAPGDGTWTLNPVAADGTSSTVVEFSANELISQGYMVNVHPVNGDYDSWLVCANLGTTAGTTTSNPGSTNTTTTAPTDGTSGVGGDTPTRTLPQQAGVGASLEWPTTPIDMMIWASGVASIVLFASSLVSRRSTRTPSRWHRLGL